MNEKKSKTELIVDLEKALKKIKSLEKKLNEHESGVSEKVKSHPITTKKSRKDKSPVISEIALLKTLFEVIPLPVFTKNIDGKYTGCNKAFERFLGRKRDEIIGKTVYDISPREIAQKYEMMDDELFRSGGEQIYEWIVEDSSGNEKNVLFNKACYLNADGNVEGLIGVISDISERKKGETLVKKSEYFFRSIWEKSSEGMRLTDKNGVTVLVNQAFCDLSGKTREELEGNSLAEIYFTEDRKNILENYKKRYAENKIEQHFSRKIKLWNKKELWFAVSTSSLDIGDGNPLVLSIFLDITERKRIEEVLVEKENYYRTILHSLQEDIIVIDADYTVTDINNSYLKTTGLTRKEAIGKKCYEITHQIKEPCNKRGEKCPLLEVFKTGNPQRCVHIHKDADGREVHIDILMSPYKDRKGKVTHIVETSRNITEFLIAQDVIKKGEALYRTILYSIGDAIITTDTHGKVMQMNKIAEKITGYSEKEVMNQPLSTFFKIINEETRVAVENPVDKVLKENIVVGLANHTILISKDGKEIPIADSGAPIIDNSGNTIGVVLVFRDQTKEREAENRLTESEKKYRQLITQTNRGIALHEVICNKKGEVIDYRFLEANDAFFHLTGLNREETIGKTVLEVLPGTEKYWIEKYGEVALKGKSVQFENYSKELNKYFEVVAYSPQPKQFATIVSDISIRKKQEKEISGAHEVFKKTFHNSPIPSSLTRVNDLVLTDVNDAFCQAIGYKKEEIINKPTTDFNIWVNLKSRQFIVMKVIGSGSLKDYEFEFRTKNGEIRHGLGYFELIEINNEKYILGNILDITDRKQSEKLLQENEEKFRSYINNSPHGIYLVNAEGSYIDVNPGAEKQLGYSKEEMLQMHITDLIRDEDLQKGKEHFNQLLREGEAVGEFRFYTKTGSHLDVVLKAKKISENIFIGVATDITEIKKTEKALRKSEEKYRNYFERDISGDYLSTPGGKLIDCNPAFAQMLGYDSAEEILSVNTETFYPYQSDRQKFIDKLTDEKLLVNYEFDMVKKDGSIIHCMENVVGVFNDRNELIEFQGYVLDITERKRAEEQLRRERERLENIIKGTNTATWEWNVQTGETIFNERWAEMIGYTLDEISPVSIETWMNFAHPEDLKKSNELLEKHFNGELEYYEFESRMRHKNSNWIWVLDRGKVFSWTKDGKPIMMMGTHQDITERKREQELLSFEARYRQVLMEHSKDGIVILDQDGCVFESNKKFAEMLGYSLESMRRLNVLDWEFLHTREQVIEMIRSVDERGDIFETKHRRKDGSIYDVEISTNASWFKGQKLIFCICRDITDRKQAEKALKESEERFNLAMRASNDGLFDWNLITNEIYYSPRWKSILGYEDHEIPNDFSVWETNTDPEDVKKSWELQRKLITNQIDRFVMEFKMKHKDGHWVDILSRAEAIFNETGKAVRMVGTHTDITERKRAEEVLRQSEALLANSQQIAHLGSWRFDVHANRLYWSDEVFRIFGCEPQEFEVTYEDFLGFVHPDDRDAVNDAYSHSVQEGSEFGEMEHRIIRKSTGEVRFVHQRGVFEYDDAGTVIRSIGMVHDITERKLIEEHLRQFQNIVSSTTDGIAFLDKEYRYIIVNDAYERFSGIKKEIFVGRNITEYLGKDVFEQVVKPHFDKCLQGETITYQDWFEFPSLGRRFVEVTYSPYRDVRNNISGVLSNTRDITERKLAEEALRESEEKHRRLFETMSPGVVYQDADGKILSANPASERILHISLKQMKDKTSWDPRWRMILEDGTYVPGSEHPAMISLRIGEKIGPVIRGIFIPEKNEYVWLSITAVPVFNEGEEKPHQVYSTFEDITERKRAEEALRERDKQYFTLLESLSDSVYVLDSEMRHIIVNEAATQFVQMPREKLLGNKLTNLFPGIEKTDFFKVFKKVLETRESDVVISEFHFEDGRKGWYEVHVDPVPEGILCISRDITERKRAEEALRISENRFHDLFERAPLGYQSLDENGCFIEVNEAWLDILGYSREEVIEAWFGDFLAPEYVQTFQENFPSFKSAGRISVEFEMLTKNRVRRWISFVGRIAYKPDGSIMQTHCILQDITESKKVGEALRNSQKEYAFLAQTASELLTLSSIADIYDYTATKLYELLDKNCIVAIVEYETDRNIWKMKKIVGISDNLIKITGVLGFSPEKFEGEISTKLYEKVLSGKLVELEFNFPILFNNKLSEKVGEILKKMLSIDKLFSISFQQNNQLLGNISLIMKKGSKELNSSLIEAFVNQVTNFLKKQKAEQEIINKMNEINRFNKLMVGREHKMIELKKEVNQLLAQNGLPKKYKIDEQTEQL